MKKSSRMISESNDNRSSIMLFRAGEKLTDNFSVSCMYTVEISDSNNRIIKQSIILRNIIINF